MKTLILGGVRSGKSRFGEQLAVVSELPVTYIATATAGDDEMRTRIAAHREHRPKDWLVIEEPIQLGRALQSHAAVNSLLLVDCLTLWLTNLLTAKSDSVFKQERSALLATLPDLKGKIILISNETNMGITPMGALSRRYCDEAGRLHQELAGLCDRVILMVAGLPQIMKGDLP